MKLTETQLNAKIRKRNKYNLILDFLKEPHKCTECAKKLKFSVSICQVYLNFLHRAGYIKIYQMVDKTRIWQSINFDYKEDGVDYDQVPEVYVRPEKPANTLGDPIYKHTMESLSQKYRDTDALKRSERKYVKVHISGAQSYQ